MLSSTKVVMLEPSRLALLMDLLATSVQNISPSLRKRKRERERVQDGCKILTSHVV